MSTKLPKTEKSVSLDAPANVQCEDAVIGLSRNNWYTNAHVYDCTCVEMRLRGAARDVQQFFQEPYIFSAQLRRQNETSWAALKYFVKFLYYPAMYIKKFRSVSFVRNDVPTFTASTYGDSETMSLLLLDPDVMKLNSDDSQDVNEYLISNGDNRMQIEIIKGRKQGIHGCQDNDYRNIKYHDHGSHSFHIYVKVYTV
ncbi:hypothetical protein DdX_21089 [Ditylenchus destructor]|uniref:Uncharacterized protein n=1 Tax=Ditylenchus destructor TaxID=166010 RepID=A0AAD4QVV1_9BILA|nr:hypothetical protein DdX_21089 [Ditylenchus destructor]